MPKRAPTPPPGDDEPRCLTVCHPYPPHVNVEVLGEKLSLARWLACCIGSPRDLYGIFHKPSARNMVIIEVRRDYPNFRRLLGAHKWSEFVKAPGEHSDKVTKIYFSTFSTGRAAEKAGWKREFVVDDWFYDLSPINKYIAHPYPLSSYCDLPSEDKTGLALCRPIPRDLFFIQITAPPPAPVGSADWAAQKEICRTKKEYAAISAAYAQLGLEVPTASTSTDPQLSPYSATGRGGSPAGFNGVNAGGSSGCTSETGSEIKYMHNTYAPSGPAQGRGSSGNVSISGDGDFSEGLHGVSNMEDEFGSLKIHPATADDGTPLCPTHGVVCKKGICRDYNALIRRIQKKKQFTRDSSGKANGGPNWKAETSSKSSVRGRGRGNLKTRGGGNARGGTTANGVSASRSRG